MHRSRYLPGIIGWGAMVVFAVVFDIVASRKKQLTLSATMGHYMAQPVTGPIVAGASAGLYYHLFIEELLPAFMDVWQARKQA